MKMLKAVVFRHLLKSPIRDVKIHMKKKRIFVLSLCAILLVAWILVAVFRSKRPVLYRVTYLPSLGGKFTLPFSINDRGQIAGFSEIKNGTLFLWDREKGIQDLGPVSRTSIYINNAGQIAATMQDPNGNEHAFIWYPNSGRTILPTLGGKDATVHGINNHGQVVGAAKTASDVFHAFAWDAVGGMRDLTLSGTTYSRAVSINDAGQVVVYFQGSWYRLVDVNEGVAPASPFVPVLQHKDINNNGFIAGIVRMGPDKFDIGLWHPNSGMKKLLQLNVDLTDTAKINDVNQVVYTKHRQAKFQLFGRTLLSHAPQVYLVEPKLGRISLNRYVSIGMNEDFYLTDINNKGCIIGAVRSTKNSRTRGVLLEPIPEKWNK